MLIEFDKMKSVTIPHLNGGEGSVTAAMYMDDSGKVMYSVIPVGSSIGLHTQSSGNDINYVISGQGEAVCDGKKEILKPGVCHYCPKGSEHTIINTGSEDLVLFTVVPEQK
ncbi:MAG: cupin domain-containing protein [Clostridia bacterium]|nr:cupin domain-containing protein [Clostridia bacterium]